MRPKRLLTSIYLTLGALLVWFGVTSQALAQGLPKFDVKDFTSLAPADTPDTIAPGTKITADNWQQYKRFIPVGLQLMLSGRYFWKLPATQDFAIEVGPTTSIPLPKHYKEDTEKYHGQAQLVPADTGGYLIKGYMAGAPFPNPAGPLAGEQILYSNYYQYQPYVLVDLYHELLMDRYNNKTTLTSLEVQNRLSHVSDVGMPMTRPEGAGYLFTSFNEVLAPEQSKYTAELLVTRDDPNEPQEVYVFLPSLRRSLRLSSSSRCAPLLGSDYVVDDDRGFNGLVKLFTVKYLGRKKVLGMVHMNELGRHNLNNYSLGEHSVPWPKATLGKWELRDAYIIDIRPVPSYTYCYGSKTLYVDSETLVPIHADIYDKDLTFWKLTTFFGTPVPIDDGAGSRAVLNGDVVSDMVDFQNEHVSFAWQESTVKVNAQTPMIYRDLSLYAFPSGMSQIMK